MKHIHRIVLPAVALLSTALAQNTAHNQLTPEERRTGWRLLFDGSSMSSWIDPRQQHPPGDAWTIENGTLKAKANPVITEDLVSVSRFRDFELVFDWRISPRGNSGVKYRIQEFVLNSKDLLKPEDAAALKGKRFEDTINYLLEHPYQRSALAPGQHAQNYVVGFEYQVIDNAGLPEGRRAGDQSVGGLYDMVAPSRDASRPVGEWNHSRLVVSGKHVEHWLNGIKVVDTMLDSEQVQAGIAKRWGKESEVYRLLASQPRKDCPISLQNHGAEAWFRDIKLRTLK